MVQTSTYPGYSVFLEKRDAIIRLIEQLSNVISALDMTGRQDILVNLDERVRADNFKVLVVGEFKRGKSTFINAMLGDEILPAYAKPCTAIINEVKWGDEPQALLYPEKTENGDNALPTEVPIKEIEEYVVIQDGVDERDAIHNSLYEKLELLWPLELCRNGVEIIDSPGLNEHDIRQKVTMDYLSTVDAILFVLSCEALCSKSELDVINNTLISSGHEDIFFICNRFNNIRRNEREMIRQHGLTKLAPLTKRGEERVFFINALGALEGRLDQDETEVEKSGVPQVEQELEKFLATERGQVKLLRPATELKNTIQEARRVIPEREAMLSTDLKTLEKRYQKAQEPLKRLEMNRQQMVAQITNFRTDTKLIVSDKAREFYRNLADKVSNWANDYSLQNEVKFFSLEGLKPQVEKAVEELVEYLSGQVESEFSSWRNQELQPLVQSRLEAKKKELDEKASEFISQVDDLRLQVAGISPNSMPDDISEGDLGKRKISALERVLSAAGGFLIGGFGSAGIGAVYGYEEMLKSLIPQIALSVATIALVGLNPWVLIPVMASGGVIQGLLSTKGTNDKLKKAVSQKYATELRSLCHARADELAEAVSEKLRELEDAINEGLGQEIQAVREQVDSILKEKQKGQANVDRQIQQLVDSEHVLNKVDSQLDELILEIAKL